MKKILSCLIIAALVLSLGVSAFAATAKVNVEEVSAKVGETVKVDVTVENVTFCGFDMKVVYDNTKATLKNIIKGEKLEGFFEGNAEAGLVSFANSKDQTLTGVLFTLEFEVVAEGTHEISVVVDSLYGVDMIDLEVSVDAGKIDVAHVHEWVKGETVEPWCTTKGYTVYNCACGESEKRDWVDALDHDWVFVELVENGELYECSRCHEQCIEAVTGDVIGVVVALLAVSGLGITVLKKKEN